MDLKYENIPSFVLHTIHLIYLAHGTSTFFVDFKSESIPSFVPPTFHLIYLAQDSNTRNNPYNKRSNPQYFTIIPSFVFHTFLLIYLSQDNNSYSNCIIINNLKENSLFSSIFKTPSIFYFSRHIKGPRLLNEPQVLSRFFALHLKIVFYKYLFRGI